MIAVSDGTPKNEQIPDGIREIAAWLMRYGKGARVTVRPCCPIHGKLMDAGTTQDGWTHYYCKEVNKDGTRCRQSRQAKPRVV